MLRAAVGVLRRYDCVVDEDEVAAAADCEAAAEDADAASLALLLLKPSG